MTWGCRGGIFVPASVFALPAKRLKRTSHRSAAKLYRAKSLCPFTCERSDAQFRLSRKKVEDVCSDAAKRSELNERRHRLLNPNTCRGTRRGPRHEIGLRRLAVGGDAAGSPSFAPERPTR